MQSLRSPQCLPQPQRLPQPLTQSGSRPLTPTQPLLLFLLIICLFSFQPGAGDSSLPAPLAEQYRAYREKDHLSGWIYSQLQWVAKDPVSRAWLLARTVRTAWRRPRTNEEIQAWQFLLVNEGYTWLLSGDIVQSIDSYTAAFQWARQHADLADDAFVLENILKPLGNNYTRLGDYEQALYIHRKALAVARSLDDKEALAGTYSNLANTASNMGQAAQSLQYCRQGLETVKYAAAIRGLLLSEEADAFRQLGQDQAARTGIQNSIAILERSFAVENKNGTHPETGYWLLTAYQQAGDICSADPRQALHFYNEALTLQTSLALRHGPVRQREKARLFRRLGDLYARMGEKDKANYWLDQCLAVLIPGKHIDSLQESDLFAENTLMDLLFTRARLAGGEGRTDEALRLYRLSFATEKELRHEFITGSSKEQSVSDSHDRFEWAIRTAWDAWERTKRPVYREAILDFMERSKAQLLLEEVLQQQELHLTASSGAALAAANSATDPSAPTIDPSSSSSSDPSASSTGARPTTTDSLTNRIRLLERALIYYKKEAAQQPPGNDSLARARSAKEQQLQWDLAELRKKRYPSPAPPAPQSSIARPSSPHAPSSVLPSAHTREPFPDSHTFARSWFAGTRTLYTVESGAEGIRFAEKEDMPEKWQDSIRAFIHTWFEDGVNKMINRPEAWYREAYACYHRLFGLHPLEKGKKYILLPDGALNGLPVDALVTEPAYVPSPAKWPFVIRNVSLSYAWSLRTLQEQLASPGNTRGISGFFLPGNTRRLPLLRAIAQEQQGIAGIVKDGKWYIDEKGTADAFRTALLESAIVHVSSHAFSGKDTPALPRIELHNEPFYIFELKDLERHPALVVLSACRTGDGRMVTGEGTQSLARAFTANGANAVVAGWWNVNDETAAQLMQGFYRSLLAGSPEPSDAAECLRRSKLDWLNNPLVTYQQKLPYYWAALNYTGNPAPLPATGIIKAQDRRIPFWLWWIIPLGALGLIIRRSLL